MLRDLTAMAFRPVTPTAVVEQVWVQALAIVADMPHRVEATWALVAVLAFLVPHVPAVHTEARHRAEVVLRAAAIAAVHAVVAATAVAVHAVVAATAAAHTAAVVAHIAVDPIAVAAVMVRQVAAVMADHRVAVDIVADLKDQSLQKC